MSEQTKFLAQQSLAGIVGGYNKTPIAGPGGALPGMKGPDLTSWRDLLRPIYQLPFPAGYGAITQPRLKAIQDLQFVTSVYAIR